jgi:hypothetical protein
VVGLTGLHRQVEQPAAWAPFCPARPDSIWRVRREVATQAPEPPKPMLPRLNRETAPGLN